MTADPDTPVPTPATGRTGPAEPRPTDLLAAMTALPLGHPARPAAREPAIGAWLPLANHLARRYSGRGDPNDDLTRTAAPAAPSCTPRPVTAGTRRRCLHVVGRVARGGPGRRSAPR